MSAARDDASFPQDTPRSRLKRVLVAADVLALLLAWTTVVIGSAGWAPPGLDGGAVVAAATAAGIGALAGHRLYRARVCAVRAAEHRGLLRTAVVTGAAAWLVTRLSGGGVSVVTLVSGAAATFVALAAGRALYRAWLRHRREAGSFQRPVLILGEGDDARTLHRVLTQHPEMGYEVRGVVGGTDDSLQDLAADLGVPVLGEGFSMVRVARALGANGAVISASGVPSERLNPLVRELQAAGLHVQLSTGLYGIAPSRLRRAPLSHEPLLYVERPSLASWQLAAKRAMDLVLASVLLVVSAPVLLASALAIKATDGGPVLFRQERIGRNGQPFTVYKLRTMHEDAEARVAELAAANEREGPLFKLDDDPRVTAVGKVLREAHLDELPQLLNVVRGHMSLVGPRPALPSEMEQFSEALRNRASVRPGITGLWQVEAGDKPYFFAYERLDLYYVENWSVSLDVAVLLSTVEALAAKAMRAAGALTPRPGPRPRGRHVSGERSRRRLVPRAAGRQAM